MTDDCSEILEYDDESLVSLYEQTETHNITLKNLALFRPKLRDSYGTNQIARFVNYYCYGVNVIEF